MAMAVDQKLLRQTKFPPEFNQKVDMKKVNVEVMKKWIARKLSEILGNEDDVVIELCFNLLEGSRFPNIKELQIQLTGFLDKDTPKFCKDLWTLCLSAQSNPQGVPKELLEAKKAELMQEKAEAEKANDAMKKNKETEAAREKVRDTIRQPERGDRGTRGDRGERGRGYGGRNPRGNDARRPPRSRSPSPRRRRSPFRPPQRRETDTYVPKGSTRNHTQRDRRGRSATRSDSESRSRSPPRRSRRTSSTSQSRSRSRSPPRKQRRTESPKRKEVGESARGSGRRASPKRRRTRSSSVDSRSPSPKVRHDRARRYTSSRSPSPRNDRRRRQRSVSSSSDESRDRRRGGRGRYSRGYRRSSASPKEYRNSRRADIVRPRTRRDNPRLSRSPDVTSSRKERDSSGSRSRSRDRSYSRSRSRSRGGRRDRKRRRSLPRYEPRNRRNTSSPTPESEPEPKPKRPKRDASRSSVSSSKSHDSHVEASNGFKRNSSQKT